MWYTERGDRILGNTEAKVFATSALDMIQGEKLEDEAFGVPVFDDLTYSQQIAMLHQVTQAFFRPEIPSPEHTAVLEGAV